jgi:hypothetical protein
MYPTAQPSLPMFTPASYLDNEPYMLDFTAVLGPVDTLVSVVGITIYESDLLPSALIIVTGFAVTQAPTSTVANTAALAWLSGGVPGSTYVISFSVLTATGRSLTRSARLYVALYR